MITSDRLDELETFRLEDDTPDDARVSVPWRDLRDLVALIPVVRIGLALHDAVCANAADGLSTAVQYAIARMEAEIE